MHIEYFTKGKKEQNKMEMQIKTKIQKAGS